MATSTPHVTSLVRQKWCAKNDRNGNPQRLFVVWNLLQETPRLVAVYDEGYRGTPPTLRTIADLGSVTVSPAEYRAMIRWAKASADVTFYSS